MEFVRDMSIIVRRMRTFADHALNEYNLGFPEQLIIMYLTAHGESNQESIASYLAIDRGAVAKTVSKLEKKGLVGRTVNPDNKREKIVISHQLPVA